MRKIKIEEFSIGSAQTIREALELIDANKAGFICVCDDQAKLLGIATDGDTYVRNN